MKGEVNKISYPDGSLYLREVKDANIRHGTGVLMLATDKSVGGFLGFIGRTTYHPGIYEAEWRNKKLSGQAIIHYADCLKYVGECKRGKFEGQGALFFADGDKYVGGFKNGEANGHGVMTFANGDQYEGKFKANYPVGEHVWTYANGMT